MTIKKIIATIILTGSAFSFSSYAQYACPTLTIKDVQDAIDNETILTKQKETLAYYTKKTNAQVLIDEPTANPFDTFYGWEAVKEFSGKPFVFLFGSVLASTPYEAKDRAKKILLAGKKIFNGEFDGGVCNY